MTSWIWHSPKGKITGKRSQWREEGVGGGWSCAVSGSGYATLCSQSRQNCVLKRVNFTVNYTVIRQEGKSYPYLQNQECSLRGKKGTFQNNTHRMIHFVYKKANIQVHLLFSRNACTTCWSRGPALGQSNEEASRFSSLRFHSHVRYCWCCRHH